MRKALLAYLVLISFLSTSCVALVIKNPFAEHRDRKKEIPTFFDVPRTNPNVIFGIAEKKLKDGYSKIHFSFNSQFTSGIPKNDSMGGILYIPDQILQNEVVVVLPGSGDEFSTSLLARDFAKLGFVAIQIHTGFTPLASSVLDRSEKANTPQEAVEIGCGFFVNAMRQRIIDLMRLNDFIMTQQHEFPRPKAIRVVGISLGGIVGSLWTGVDPRVHSFLMIISSASIAKILMDSRNEDIAKIRNILQNKFKLSHEEAYLMLKERLKDVEPLTYAYQVDPHRLLMVSGNFDMLGIPFDSAMPFSAAYDTWKAFGKPEWVTLLFTGHASSYLAFFPGWIEIPYIHHALYTTLFWESYTKHLIKHHFLPKALSR